MRLLGSTDEYNTEVVKFMITVTTSICANTKIHVPFSSQADDNGNIKLYQNISEGAQFKIFLGQFYSIREGCESLDILAWYS
jgi:hypothetical protein